LACARLGRAAGRSSHIRSVAFAAPGATLVFGSDWPVSSWDPDAILAAATDPDRGDEAMDAAEAGRLDTHRPALEWGGA
jgi:predicted amidohydrolase YtcJ